MHKMSGMFLNICGGDDTYDAGEISISNRKIFITPGKNDGDNDKMKEIIEYSTKNDFRYLEKSEVIF